jgi:predicted outer membrane repeat protein
MWKKIVLSITVMIITVISVHAQINVEGASLTAKLVWLFRNVESNGHYTIELTGNESLGAQSLAFPGKNNIFIEFTSSGGERTITLSENGSLFTVGNGVFLELGNGVTLRGHNGNNAPLVNINRGGGFQMINGSKITGNTGGGVFVSGSFLMYGGEISGNTESIGGGVGSGGTFFMVGGKISGNTAEDGGGVFIGSGTFEMHGGEITGNKASDKGGGVLINGGTFRMSGGEITNNTARSGGGIYETMTIGIRFTMTGGKVSGNTASDSGGGVFTNGVFTIEAGEISGNTATNGGGVFSSVQFTMRGGKISGNTATNDGGGLRIIATFNMSGGQISSNTGRNGGGVYATDGYSGDIISKTGGIIYGYTQGDSNSKRATAGSSNGHAVYIGSGTVRRRESTAAPNDELNSKINGIAGGWGF